MWGRLECGTKFRIQVRIVNYLSDVADAKASMDNGMEQMVNIRTLQEFLEKKNSKIVKYLRSLTEI